MCRCNLGAGLGIRIGLTRNDSIELGLVQTVYRLVLLDLLMLLAVLLIFTLLLALFVPVLQVTATNNRLRRWRREAEFAA